MADLGKPRRRAKAAFKAPPPVPSPSGTPVNQAHLRYRPDIDGLRAIAVVPVVLYHTGLGFPGGYVGVDVFFVISGYLITKIIYTLVTEGKFSFIDFYDRRIRRLFPALFVMLSAATAWSIVALISLDLKDFGASLAAATTYVSNIYFHFATAGYFHESARAMPLLHTWSLAVEEQFYIVVPFAIFGLYWGLRRRWHIPAIAAVTAASFTLCIWLTRTHHQAAFYMLPTRAWELGLGALLAIGALHIRRRWLRELLGLGGIAAILFAVFQFDDGTAFPGWRAAIPTVGTAAILSVGLAGSGVNRLLATTPFTFIGKISYSFYLWHWPAIVAFTYGAVNPATIPTSLLCVAISFALAVLSWRYVERPYRERRLSPGAKSLFRGAAVASVATAGVGAILYLSHGLPQRHPREFVALTEQANWESGRPECHKVTADRADADRLCIRGAPGVSPTFILVGDSHADALSDGLFAAARSENLSGVQFTADGFVPLPGRRALAGYSRDRITPEFLSYVGRHRELRTIILAGFWSHEATGRNYKDKPRIDIDDGYDGSGAAYTPVAFRHALERLVEAFPERRFILIDDIPSGKELSIREYARVLYRHGSAPPPVVPRAVAEAQRASYEPILRSVASGHDNVAYVPVLDRLCEAHICPLFRGDGVLLYRDGDHLSRTGSESLVADLRAVFNSQQGLRSTSF